MGLAAVALAIPLGNFVQLPGPGINGVDALVALTVTGWPERRIADRRIILRRPPLTWSLLIFVWCAALSLTQATSWHEGLPEWFKWAEFAALYLVTTQVLDRRSAGPGRSSLCSPPAHCRPPWGPTSSSPRQGRKLSLFKDVSCGPMAVSASRTPMRDIWATFFLWLPA